MGVRTVRVAATLYFVLFALFVIWPVFLPFNRPLPLILGLPFNMAAVAAWVAFGSVVLFVLDRSEERYRREAAQSRRDEAGHSPEADGGDR